MQIRESCFNKADGCQQPECVGKLHVHGHYCRYAQPEGQQWMIVPRYYCTRCGFTISVLSDSRLPYRLVAAEELEAAFDRESQAGSTTGPPAPAPSVKKSGCFDRAWSAWNRNSRRIAELFGHLLSRAASEDAAQCWRSLRETFSISEMLSILWTRFKTSLLKAYCCLQPGCRRSAAAQATHA